MVRRLIVFALAVAACGGPTVAPSPSPASLPPRSSCGVCTAPPEPTATRSAHPAAELPAPIAELEPGTYFKEGFEPKVTFTIGEGWTAVQATDGFFDIEDEPNSVDVVAVQFGNVAEADTAEEAAANVAERPNLTVSQPEDATVDGVPGIHLVVETTDPVDTNPPVFRPVIRLTPGEVSIASGRRLDLTLLDVDGEVLAIMVGGSIAKWDRAMRLATPVIESVQIGE